MRVRCSAIDITGSPGDYSITRVAAAWSNWFGDDSASNVTTQDCPGANPVARGLRVWTGVDVDAASLMCGTITLQTR